MDNNSCFIIGLPGAGKTTFLAALWYSINEKTSNTLLSLERLTGDQRYLTYLSEKWSGYEVVSRTNLEQQQEEIIVLLKSNEKEIFEVTLPDLSGEEFQKQYINREMKQSIYEFIFSTNNFLLFINPINLICPTLISSICEEDRIGEDEHTSREPSKDPTEVQLVEILQFVHEVKNNIRYNINIVISAWDVIETKYDKPEVYVKTQLPLLWQFICSNNTLWNAKYFGVSAQGGEISEDNPGEILSEKYDNPLDRILVIDNEGNHSNDITLPIHYLFNNENGG